MAVTDEALLNEAANRLQLWLKFRTMLLQMLVAVTKKTTGARKIVNWSKIGGNGIAIVSSGFLIGTFAVASGPIGLSIAGIVLGVLSVTTLFGTSGTEWFFQTAQRYKVCCEP